MGMCPQCQRNNGDSVCDDCAGELFEAENEGMKMRIADLENEINRWREEHKRCLDEMNKLDHPLLLAEGGASDCERAIKVIIKQQAEVERLRGDLEDIRLRLRGLPQSVLVGEAGLAAATMRSHDALEAEVKRMQDDCVPGP